MLLTNRLFERQPPSREAKSIYIFCEGAKREYQYFKYFVEMDSRINVEPYKLHPHEDNSPLGLLNIAISCIIQSEENPSPKFQFQENDEVWIVIDVDKDKAESRKPQIKQIIDFCSATNDWFLVQSNPCFEVWLYYHLFESVLEFEDKDKCTSWKRMLNQLQPGGFHSSRHPIFIQRAAKRTRDNFQFSNDQPENGCTEIFKLAESMLTILDDKINKVLKEIEE